MRNRILYQRIYPSDYKILTKIMTSAFNEDTSIHTNMEEDGPTGYNDGRLIKWLNEHENFESFKVIYEGNIIGAYTVGIEQNNEYSLEMFYVDPNYRGNNLGTTIWKDIEKKYVDAKKWTVETPDYTTRNHYYYTKKCGFRFLKANIFDNGSKSFIFEKEIPL